MPTTGADVVDTLIVVVDAVVRGDDESAVGAVVVGSVVDCDVGGGVDDATNVLAVSVRISVLVVVGIIVLGTMHGVT